MARDRPLWRVMSIPLDLRTPEKNEWMQPVELCCTAES